MSSKIRKISLVGFLSILLILSFLFNYFKFNESTAIALEIKRLQEVVSRFESQRDQLINNMLLEKQLSGSRLSSQTEFITRNNERIPLKEITKQKRIVFFIPSNSCNVCFDNSIQEMASIFSINHSNVVVVTDSRRIRETITFLNDHNLNLEVLGLVNELGIHLETGYVPFIFILNEDNTCINFHILDNTIPDITVKYLMHITRNFN